MPKHIEYLPIASFGEIITGKTPSTSVDEYWYGDIPFITPTDIIGYNMYHILKTERYVSTLGKNSQIKTVLPAHSICVSCIASIGKICITQEPYSITNQQINSIIVNDNYDYKYIYYCFRYYLPYLQLIAGGTGSGTPIISKNKFARLKYPVHVNVADQRCIASVLSTYDDLIENNNKRIKILEQMAQELYKEWFVRFRFPGYKNLNNIGTTKVRLTDLVKRRNVPLKKWDDLKVIDLSRMEGFSIAVKEFAEPEEFSTNVKQVKKYDLLFGAIRSYQGKAGFSPIDGAIAGSVYNFVPINGNMYCFLLMLITDKNFIQYSDNYSNGTKMPVIRYDDLVRYKLDLLNDTEVYAKFNSRVYDMIKQIDCLLRENIILAKLRDLLLPRLMSGKLEIKGIPDA